MGSADLFTNLKSPIRPRPIPQALPTHCRTSYRCYCFNRQKGSVMNAAIKLICVAAAITGCATQPMSNDVYSAAQTSTVLIRTSTGLGTGVVINDKCVLTVAHVADEDTVEFLDWKQRVTTVTRTTHDEEKDIAVVCGNASLDLPPVSLRSTMPQRYAEVFTIGNPLKNVNVLTTGRYQLNGIITAQTAPG